MPTTATKRRARSARTKEPRLVEVHLDGPQGESYGNVRVVRRSDGVRDFRPAATKHWTADELQRWRAYDEAHAKAEAYESFGPSSTLGEGGVYMRRREWPQIAWSPQTLEAHERGIGLFWFATSANKKLGDMPHAVVGATAKETWESCEGCGLRETKCYAWERSNTTRNFVLPKIEKGLKKDPERYTIDSALKRRAKTARYVRLATIGDPARADREELLRSVRLAGDAGLGVLGYTHFWAGNPELSPLLMASCDTPAEAEEAVSQGWRATTLLPWDYKGATFGVAGSLGVVCPAQRKDAVTCNSCGLCSNTHRSASRVAAIGFLDHSNEARKARRKALPLAAGRKASA